MSSCLVVECLSEPVKDVSESSKEHDSKVISKLTPVYVCVKFYQNKVFGIWYRLKIYPHTNAN